MRYKYWDKKNSCVFFVSGNLQYVTIIIIITLISINVKTKTRINGRKNVCRYCWRKNLNTPFLFIASAYCVQCNILVRLQISQIRTLDIYALRRYLLINNSKKFITIPPNFYFPQRINSSYTINNGEK